MSNTQSSRLVQSSPPEPMKVIVGRTTAAMPAPASPLLSQAPSVGPWQKVVKELGGDLPKGAATLMQDLLAQAAAWDSKTSDHQQPSQTLEKASQAHDEKIEAVRWLTQHLERQQEASVNKLRSILANPDGLNVPTQPSRTFSLPLTAPIPVHEPMPCTDLAPGGDCANSAGHDLFSSTPPPTPSSGTCMDDSSPSFGLMLFPEAEGHQRLPTEAGHGIGQSAEGGTWQSAGQSTMKAAAGPRQPGWVGTVAPKIAGGPPETLRMHLRSLLNVDSGRVLIVRKINRLGFASSAVLQEHFSWYGVVERVLVAHSRVKSASATGRCASVVSSRLRPSGLGFVVMSKVEEAQAILAHGSEQPAKGIIIQVQQFERRMTCDEADCDEDEHETTMPETSSSEENRNSTTSSSSSEESD